MNTKVYATPTSDAILWIDVTNAQTVLSEKKATEDLKKMASSFMNEGFIVVKAAVSHELCERAVLDIEEFLSRNCEVIGSEIKANFDFDRILNLHSAIPSLKQVFAGATSALELQDFLFGYRTALYTSIVFRRGSQQSIHRDAPFFCTVPENFYFGMWVALESTDRENGPLIVIPASHKIDEPSRTDIAKRFYKNLDDVPSSTPALWDAYMEELLKLSDSAGLQAREVHVDKGDVIIWHPKLLHGGAKHISKQRTRYSLVCHTTPKGTPVYHQDVFFNPTKIVPSKATWNYVSLDNNREAVQHLAIDINHNRVIPVGELR